LTTYGVGSIIQAGDKIADFTGGTLVFNAPNYLPPSALLQVQGQAVVRNADLHILFPDGRPTIAVGDRLHLLAARLLAANLDTLTLETAGGDTLVLALNGNQLDAVLAQVAPTTPSFERMKAYAANRAANLTFLNQGLDFMLNRGFRSALASTSGPGHQFGTFGGVGGGWVRQHTNSHVDVYGASMLAGLGVGTDLWGGRLTLGVFFEGGWGSYDSYNSFSNAASVNGDGDIDYYGGGLLFRHDFLAPKASALIPTPDQPTRQTLLRHGPYVEASARLGRTHSDFNTDDLRYNNWKAEFDTAAQYYSLHGGLGYIWLVPGLNDRGSLDFSAKFLWTRLESDTVTVYNDRVKLKTADSLRSRLGTRFTYDLSDQVVPYVGAYWEHEYDGDVGADVNNRSLDSSSLEGDTAIGEFGVTLRPSDTLPLAIDLGAQGHLGRREGVTGSLQLRLEF
jgi:outer membrane autotransporter protein